jgi:hypothetical protein
LEIGSTLVLLLEASETFSPLGSCFGRPAERGPSLICSFGRKLRYGTEQGVARGSRTVGRRSRDAPRGADGRRFSPAAKKGNFFCLVAGTRLAGRRRNAAALTPVDGLVSPGKILPSDELTDGGAAELLPPGQCKTAALGDAYRVAGVCKKAGQGQQSNKCRRMSLLFFWEFF